MASNKGLTRGLPFKTLVTPFSGDPHLLDFFIEQVKFKIENSKWEESHALAFVKSKLADTALKFYVSSPACQKAKNTKELFNIFKKYFKVESATAIAQQFNEFKFESDVNINIFANKLENLVRKRFPDMEEKALEQLLIAKFNDLIPPHFRIHLLSQKATTFYQMVECLEKFQEIYNLQVNPVLPGTSFATIQNFNHKIDSEVIGTNSENNLTKINNSSYSKRPYNKFPQNKGSHTIQCQWCERPGHSAQRCFALRKLQNNKFSHRYRNGQTFSRPYRDMSRRARAPKTFKSNSPQTKSSHSQ